MKLWGFNIAKSLNFFCRFFENLINFFKANTTPETVKSVRTFSSVPGRAVLFLLTFSLLIASGYHNYTPKTSGKKPERIKVHLLKKTPHFEIVCTESFFMKVY